MTRLRQVKGDVLETTGGNYKVYSKDNIEIHSQSEIIQTGKENGLSFSKPKKFEPKTSLKVTKVEGPFDENDKLVKVVKKGEYYTYKATPSRKPEVAEVKLLKWATKNDDVKIKELAGASSHNVLAKDGKILIAVTINENCEKARIYAYFKKASENVRIEVLIESKYPKLYISSTTTGFTIQKLYGHNAAKNLLVPYEPAVVVTTYKAYLKFYENGVTKDIIEFNVTRDAWWYLGVKDGKYHLLNRTFEPLDGGKNLYLTDEIHFPSKAPDECRGYFLLQENKRVIDAEPFETEVDVDNKIIGENRITKDKAKNVMLHIGGAYKAGIKGLGVEWLGGSLGCFAFIPDNDVYSTDELARKASYDDDYDDDLSNSHWLKVTNKINELRDLDSQKRFFIIINKRVNWIKTKDIDFDKLLKE